MYMEVSLLCQMQRIPLIFYSDGADIIASKIRDLQIELGLIFTFPHILPAQVTEAPLHGTWNFHGSPLPAYRGPDPLFWQIRNGERTAALTLHRATTKVDAGDIAACRTTDITPLEIKGTLFDKISQMAPGMASEMIDKLSAGIELDLTPQDKGKVSTQARPGIEDLIIRWEQMDATEVLHLIHACNPDYSGAMSWIRGSEVRLLEAESFHCNTPIKAAQGCIINAPDDPNLYVVCAKDSYIRANVISTANAISSGIKFKSMFGLRSGEMFSDQPQGKVLSH